MAEFMVTAVISPLQVPCQPDKIFPDMLIFLNSKDFSLLGVHNTLLYPCIISVMDV